MAFNILIVDDSQTTRNMIAKTLRLAHIPLNEVFEAANGEEALAILSKEWIDLVFADLNMPVMTGIEMIDKMSEDGILASVPVVVVSTEGSETRIEELKGKGITAYVRKPFLPETIRGLVDDILGSSNEE